MFASMRFQEVRGRWPWGRKVKKGEEDVEGSARESEGGSSVVGDEKRTQVVGLKTAGAVAE